MSKYFISILFAFLKSTDGGLVFDTFYDGNYFTFLDSQMILLTCPWTKEIELEREEDLWVIMGLDFDGRESLLLTNSLLSSS